MTPHLEIVKGNPGWIQLLKQEGLFYKKYKPGDNPNILIVDEFTDEKSEILEYLREGGSILTSTEILGELLDEKTKRVNIKYIIPDTSPFFSNVDILDIYNKGYVLNKNGYGRVNNRFPAIFELSYKKGTVIALPFDVSPVDTSKRMKFFYAEKGKFPTEVVSSVSRGEVRKLVINSIRYLFQKRGLYYVHKWYYPEGKKNAFSFRIDTDNSCYKEIHDTYRIAQKNGLGFTFFIDVKSIGDSIGRLKELRNQEIAVHCFEHRIYKDILENRKHFSRAKRLLLNAGTEISGIAAPYGIWNSSLGFLFEELGFLYSTEFSFSYDALPSHPLLEKRFSNVLQIPVHPISPGTLFYAKNSITDIINYFEYVIEEKYRKEEPLFLYGHSGIISRNPIILESIIHTVKNKKDVWMGTYKDFYNWWELRDNTTPEITIKNRILKLEGIDKNNSLFLHIISPEGKEGVVRMVEKIDLSRLKLKEKDKTRPFDRKKMRVKKGELKLMLKEMEHWIRR